MILTLAITVILLVLVLFWAYGGLRETVGEYISEIFPKAPHKKGDKVDVFLNGAYNRTATITGVSPDKIYIYDGKLGLPVDYRGRFYAVAIDKADDSRLVYIGDRKHYRFVRTAEFVRTKFALIDDEEMLPITDEVAMADSDNDPTEETDETEGVGDGL